MLGMLIICLMKILTIIKGTKLRRLVWVIRSIELQEDQRVKKGQRTLRGKILYQTKLRNVKNEGIPIIRLQK